MRSASFRWAIEKIETRGLPSGVCNIELRFSASPSSQTSKPGAATRLLRRKANSNRSLRGKKDSRSRAPTRVMGGVWTCWTRDTRSRSRPCFQAALKIVERRICSRLCRGSLSKPVSPSRLVTVPLIRSRKSSGSSLMV